VSHTDLPAKTFDGLLYSDKDRLISAVETYEGLQNPVHEDEEKKKKPAKLPNRELVERNAQLEQNLDLAQLELEASQRSLNSPLLQRDMAEGLRESIGQLTSAVKDIDGFRRLTRAKMPTNATKGETDAKEAELQADPLVQRMLSAGVISLKDIVKGDTIPLLEDNATRAVVQRRLDQLEQEAKAKLGPMSKEYTQRQTKAFQRTIPNTKFKMYVPPRYAPAGTLGAKRQRPKTAGAMIGFPTSAYYT
jgi:hypothetical protein